QNILRQNAQLLQQNARLQNAQTGVNRVAVQPRTTTAQRPNVASQNIANAQANAQILQRQQMMNDHNNWMNQRDSDRRFNDQLNMWNAQNRQAFSRLEDKQRWNRIQASKPRETFLGY